MSSLDVEHSGLDLVVGGNRFRLDHPIRTAWGLRDRVIVLFDPEAEPGKFGQFPNLVGLNAEGALLWTAELPTSRTGDRYYCVQSTDPIVVSSETSFDCEIDPLTGRILRTEFFK